MEKLVRVNIRAKLPNRYERKSSGPSIITIMRITQVVANSDMAAILFGAIGIMYTTRDSKQDRLLWLTMAFYLAGLVFLTHGSPRFRLMVAPILIVYAGYGLFLVAEGIKAFHPTCLRLVMSKKLVITSLVLVVLLVNFGFSLRGFLGGFL